MNGIVDYFRENTVKCIIGIILVLGLATILISIPSNSDREDVRDKIKKNEASRIIENNKSQNSNKSPMGIPSSGQLPKESPIYSLSLVMEKITRLCVENNGFKSVSKKGDNIIIICANKKRVMTTPEKIGITPEAAEKIQAFNKIYDRRS